MDPTLGGKSPHVADEPDAAAVALFGSLHANLRALESAVQIARQRGTDRIYSLGDLVGLGPHPDRTLKLALESKIRCLQGDYEINLSSGVEEIDCDVTSPGEMFVTKAALDYTSDRLSAQDLDSMGRFPHHFRFMLGKHRVLLVHGSPVRVAESCWESRDDSEFQPWFEEQHVDVVACDHTGLAWTREVMPGKWIINVGSLGRPANNGRHEGTLVILSEGPSIEFVSVPYDRQAVVEEMRNEKLADDLWRTVDEGYWHCFLDSLPALERARGRY